MFKSWQHNNGSSVEVVNVAETAFTDFDDVKAAQRRTADAVADFAALQAEDKKYNKMLSPYVTQDGAAVDAIERAHAVAAWPDVKRRLALAEAVKIQAERDLQRVLEQARQRVAEARVPGRRPLMQELFKQLDVCVTLAEKLNRYDEETYRLCSSRPEAPAPELLPSWSSGESAVTYRRRYFKHWLS